MPNAAMSQKPIAPPRRSDVELVSATTLGASYGRLFQYRLRHRRFDGDWTQEITRDCFDSGPAVVVLPYDPATDEVLLITQFRMGPYVAGGDPWTFEIPAGRIDKKNATPEEIAIGEAREEAGLEIAELERIAGFFTSPGIFSERIDAFCGRASNMRGGVFGLAEEHEDIKAEVMGAERAIELAQIGAITSGPTLVTLFWLAMNRERLRRIWT